MKAVQSFWSLPMNRPSKADMFARSDGGWTHRKYFYYSWALSCLQLGKYFDRVELVTDELGHFLLIEQLELPYTNTVVQLDTLNGFHPDLWALGKLHAYSIQDEPFVHIDSDVFLFEKLEDRLLTADLFGQNIEYQYSFYQEILADVYQNFSTIPACVQNLPLNELTAVNAGILGGSNIEFFKRYTREAFEFVTRNIESHDKVNLGMFNCVFEQMLMHYLAHEENLEIQFMFPDRLSIPTSITRFQDVPDKVKYIHLQGGYKKHFYCFRNVEMRLRDNYPDYYKRINALMSTYEI
jgi:hypothetical protein